MYSTTWQANTAVKTREYFMNCSAAWHGYSYSIECPPLGRFVCVPGLTSCKTVQVPNNHYHKRIWSIKRNKGISHTNKHQNILAPAYNSRTIYSISSGPHSAYSSAGGMPEKIWSACLLHKMWWLVFCKTAKEWNKSTRHAQQNFQSSLGLLHWVWDMG